MTDSMNDPAEVAKDMLADLHHLVDALDRRVPRFERLGEEQIAHDAADLRQRAMTLIRQLEIAADQT